MSTGQPQTPRTQRPRVTLMIPENNAYQDQQHSPFIMTAATSIPSQGHPGWPNPFLQQLYAQKAGDFVCKQFEGLNRFTKGGLSLGEKSAVWLYAKFRSWSRKWFTHFFLFLIVLLYSVLGAWIFQYLEGIFFHLYELLWRLRQIPSKIYDRNLSCFNGTCMNKDFSQGCRH